MFISKILISDDFEGVREELIAEFGINTLRFIPKNVPNQFLLEDARAVEKKAILQKVVKKSLF